MQYWYSQKDDKITSYLIPFILIHNVIIIDNTAVQKLYYYYAKNILYLMRVNLKLLPL